MSRGQGKVIAGQHRCVEQKACFRIKQGPESYSRTRDRKEKE